MALSINEALEILIMDTWNDGQEQFVNSLVTFIRMNQADQLQTIKNKLQGKVNEKIVQRDAILPNAQTAVDVLQAEIDEMQAFIDA